MTLSLIFQEWDYRLRKRRNFYDWPTRYLDAIFRFNINRTIERESDSWITYVRNATSQSETSMSISSRIETEMGGNFSVMSKKEVNTEPKISIMKVEEIMDEEIEELNDILDLA